MTTKLEQAARQALEMMDAGSYIPAMRVLREALDKQAEQDLDTCPGCGGVADNGHDREFPPNPYYCTKCTEQAEQEPVVKIHKYNEFQTLGSLNLPIGTKLYAAPVRTKDLTDAEIRKLWNDAELDIRWFARAVIAADREKNK